MRWSTKDFLSFTLLAVGVDGPPIPIDDLLLAFASKRITNQLDASDWAARKTRQAISALVEYQNERVNTGREPHIKTILHVHPVEVVGAAWLSPEDDWQHRSKKLAISRTTGLHSNIQKLSPNEFEKLCERILVLMGCELTSTDASTFMPMSTRTTFLATSPATYTHGSLDRRSTLIPAAWEPKIAERLSGR